MSRNSLRTYRSAAILPIVAVAVLFLGATLVVPDAAAQAGSSTLSGTVCTSDGVYYIMAPGDTSQACGREIPGASLHLTKPGVANTLVGAVDKTATSDANGAFSFTGLDDGTYALEVTRSGFDAWSEDVAVQGASTKQVVMAPQDVVVPGKLVSDPTGNPVAGANINVCCTKDGQSVDARSDAEGAFELKVLAGWRYAYVSGATGHRELSHEFFADGSAVEMRLEKLPPPDAYVEGTVTDQDGKPLADILVNIYSYGGYATPMADPASGAESSPVCYDCGYYYGGNNASRTDAAGKYRIGIYGTSAQVSVNQEGYTSFYEYVDVAKGATATLDVRILKIPEKTAHVTGQVVDAVTGKGLRYASISASSPLYGVYECSMEASQATGTATAATASGKVAASDAMYYPYYPGCAIVVNDDGTFEGDLTPGYTILSVWIDSYRACAETTNADGSMTRSCGPQHFSYALVVDLAANQDTSLTLKVQPRPPLDATVAGYAVDKTTDQAIPSVQVNFYSEENGGSGYATTDGDGSFKVGLRSGYHRVSVYAEGYLPWEGMLMVAEGDNAFDIPLTPGKAAGYGCCYYPMHGAADGVAVKESGSAPPQGAPASPGTVSSTATSAPSEGDDAATSASTVEDLGGGLGPYDADARRNLTQGEPGATSDASESSPAWAVVGALAALAAAALLRRRHA